MTMQTDAPTPTSSQQADLAGAARAGVVLAVQSSVVDVCFDAHLPPADTLLRCGRGNEVAVEVLGQLDAWRVRSIALTPTQVLARGMAVGHGARRQED